MSAPGPSHESIQVELDKILASRPFARTESLVRLLRYLVEQTLLGNGDNLREYRIGAEAFGRGDSFNPHTDPIVRVQVGRLRTKLEEYYRGAGRSDTVVLDLPKGSYIPQFTHAPGSARARLTRRKAVGIAASVLIPAAGLFLFHSRRKEPYAKTPRSIAVLPFKNLSQDSAQEYFADGLTEAFINELSQIRSLRVVSRTSVMSYKNARKSLPEIAREVKADAVVEDAVTRSSGKVRVTVQLIDAATDRYLWGQTYERNLDDILDLQKEMARKIALEIRAELTAGDQNRLATSRRIRPEALQPYLEARYYASQSSPDALKKSILLYQTMR